MRTKRLVGRCMSFISEIDECCYDEDDIANIFRQSAGGTIIIELRGSRGEHRNYATCFEKVIEDFCEKICKYQRDTLFIFVENTENPGFSPRFITSLAGILSKEGILQSGEFIECSRIYLVSEYVGRHH